jgi:hypothetical protein
MFTAVGSKRIETGASVVGEEAPPAFDPAVQFESLESGVKRALFDAQGDRRTIAGFAGDIGQGLLCRSAGGVLGRRFVFGTLAATRPFGKCYKGRNDERLVQAYL